jgi:LPXTG-motif cell wall-anchored protein
MKNKISILTLVLFFTVTQLLFGYGAIAKAEEGSFSVKVIVNSYDKNIAEDISTKSNALDALKETLDKKGINLTMKSASWGGQYISEIAGVQEKALKGSDGWLYAVNRGGAYVDIMTGIDGFNLKNGDKLIVYYGDFNTVTLNHIAFSTTEEGKQVTISLSNTYLDWQTGKPVVNSINGLSKIKIDGIEYPVTGNSVTLSQGLSYGNHILEVVDFNANKAPVVVTDNNIMIKFQADSGKPQEEKPDTEEKPEVSKDIDSEFTAVKDYLRANSDDPWAALTLQKLGIKAGESFIKENAETILSDGIEYYSNTDLEKLILNLTALGYTPYNFAGKNLVAELLNRKEENFLINDAAFALIVYNYANVQEEYKLTKEKLINVILQKAIVKDGSTGWALSGDSINPDITGLVLSALAPYNNDSYPTVKEVLVKAVDSLSKLQNEKGYLADSFGIFSESQGFAIIGLAAIGENPEGEKFTKAEDDLVSALISFKGTEGQYKHELKGQDNYIATEQAFRALYTLQQYKKTGKYDFYSSNIKAKELPEYKYAEVNNTKPTLPQTGSPFDSGVLIFFGVMLVATGSFIVSRGKKSTLNSK